MLITGHGSNPSRIFLVFVNIAIVSRRHDFWCRFCCCSQPSSALGLLSSLLWWKWYRRLTGLEPQYSSTGLPHICIRVHKRALRWRIGGYNNAKDKLCWLAREAKTYYQVTVTAPNLDAYIDRLTLFLVQ
jgi:hypothetical protein